jgi:hypothetical protein
MMTRSEAVLIRKWTLGTLVTFEDGEGIDLRLSRATWDDMGRPDRVTVTVEPGDRLNADG